MLAVVPSDSTTWKWSGDVCRNSNCVIPNTSQILMSKSGCSTTKV